MNKNIMTIIIDRPIDQVFAYSIDPANTPRWFGNILEETASEYPPKIGTVYKSRRVATPDVWGQVVVANIHPNQMFQLKGTGFNVRYTYRRIDESSTELTYTEWADEDELRYFTPIDNLKKLKAAIEGSATPNWL
jgi:uncharacterized protein YndB with AHSA1/START domain